MEAKEHTLARIYDLGLIAVLRGPTPQLTLKMVEALVEGGVRGIEITYTTPKATEVVRELRQLHADRITLGMGTLTSPEHAELALQTGASFIVSPHLEESLARHGGHRTAHDGGAMTPSEVVHSRNLGSDVVKLFPGSQVEPGYLRVLRGPFPDLPIMPTGGVNPDNVGSWFDAGAFAVGAGSALCPRS